MTEELAMMLGLFVAKQIKAEIDAQRLMISEEQIAAKIAANLISITAARTIIQQEMAQYAAVKGGA